MPPVRSQYTLCSAFVMALAWIGGGECAAQTVWSGLTLTFEKEDGTQAELEANQDRITDTVWISRGALGFGLINAFSECGGTFGCEYSRNFSPEGTRWANAWLNPGETIAASNYQELTFSDWEDAYDNRVGQLILNPSYRDAVVRIVGDELDDTDDIYLDLRFTAWSQQCCGGFAYMRAEAPTGPVTTGDYNGNGVVDAADYVVWRKTLNEPAVPAGSGADGDADGTVDSEDYTFWAARFGNTVPGAGSGGLSTAVPEPGAAVLLLVGVLLGGPGARQRR